MKTYAYALFAVAALGLTGGQTAHAQVMVSGADCFTAHMVGGDKQVTWIDVKTQKPAVPPEGDYQATGRGMPASLSVSQGARDIPDFTHLYNPETGQEYELIACPPKGTQQPMQYQTPGSNG
ncbi:MAG: hypothetical protein KGL11_02265 [Alphaproteobacteria bacterium]|nr:hypothetical protein [Alphaproteobacteria bacterium]